MQPLNRTKKLVNCPQCRVSVFFDSNNPFKPFCSERCQMIDLGAWATEGYSIPVPLKPEDFDELS